MLTEITLTVGPCNLSLEKKKTDLTIPCTEPSVHFSVVNVVDMKLDTDLSQFILGVLF